MLPFSTAASKSGKHLILICYTAQAAITFVSLFTATACIITPGCVAGVPEQCDRFHASLRADFEQVTQSLLEQMAYQNRLIGGLADKIHCLKEQQEQQAQQVVLLLFRPLIDS